MVGSLVGFMCFDDKEMAPCLASCYSSRCCFCVVCVYNVRDTRSWQSFLPCKCCFKEVSYQTCTLSSQHSRVLSHLPRPGARLILVSWLPNLNFLSLGNHVYSAFAPTFARNLYDSLTPHYTMSEKLKNMRLR